MKTLAILGMLGVFSLIHCSPSRRVKRAVIPGLPDTVLNDTQIQELLDRHNNMRATEGAADMIKLEWSGELAAMAQWLADDCRFTHDYPDDTLWRPYLPTSWVGKPGQNIYAAWGESSYPSLSLSRALEVFYGEKANYDYDNAMCSHAPCGHYTQLVWWDNSHLGCGVNQCQALEGAGNYAWLLVCNYGPGGNYAGELPFTKGQACSLCTSAYPYCTGDGLCCDNEETGCGPAEQVGSHTVRCLQDLWKFVGCWENGTSYPSMANAPTTGQYSYWQSLSVLDLRIDMSNFHFKAVKSIVDNKPKWDSFQDMCYGPGFLRNCAALDDTQHGNHSVQCMQDAWAVAGCTKQGTLYPRDAGANSGWWQTQTVRGMIKDMYLISNKIDQTQCRGH